MSQVICEYCNSTLSSKYVLKNHLFNNKACLSIRNLELKTNFVCRGCEQYCVDIHKLSNHHQTCRSYQFLLLNEEYDMKLQKINEEYDLKLKEKNKEIKDIESSFKKERETYEKTIKDLQKQVDKMFYTIEKLASQAIDKPNTTNVTNIESFEKETIPIPLKEKISSIIIEEIKDEDTLNYSMITLNNVSITSRPIDHYVNATQLCQAGGKLFKDWFRLESTKELINELSADGGILPSAFVETNKGGNNKSEQGSWIHPDLSISLAQWISPKFSIQVSKWVRTLFNKGSVEIDINLLRQKDERIKKLENVCLSKQRRVEYPEKNVIYLLTTDDQLKRRTYILGKAKNLTNRLGTYNKTCDHTVVYYKECKNEQDMDTAEIIVLSKLKDYREQANRDRFILPEDKDISFFIGIIDSCIHFLK